MIPPQRPTLLVIEDDEAVRQTLVVMLQLNGFRTLSAPDGASGLALARTEHPSLVLTDLAMPGLTGFELLEIFRADLKLRTVPVIVISAKADRASTRRGMELGADDFITKPFTEEEVIHSVTTRLEKKELLDELDSFAHTVAHDLKNPLCTLNGRIELAAMLVGKTDEATLRHHLTEAAHSAARLSSIIEELLVLAGVRQQRIVPRPLDLPAIVAEAVDRLDNLLRRNAARIQLPPTWPAAVGHAPWVIEVWVNYLSNAAKYGGAAPLIVLGGEAAPDGRTARFWVQDHGPGLDEALQRQMFVPFTQIASVRADGHGLGLSIVRRIVEKLGGTVGVASTPGQGARFWFELPTTPTPAPLTPGIAPPLFTP